MNERDSEANTKAVDWLLNFETVKYFANEEHEARRFDVALAAYERAAVKSQTTLSAMNIGQGIIIACGLVGVMLLAARGIVAGTMTVGDFVLVNSYLVQLYAPLEPARHGLSQHQAVADRSRSDVPAAARQGRGRRQAERARACRDARRDRVRPCLLRLRSAPADPARRVVPRARRAARSRSSGRSGAGKSTISRLLFRFYDVDDGAIRIDGQDMRDVTQDSLRRAIGVVPQDTVLFNDTIRYNIAYGRPGAAPGEIEEAARRAHLDNSSRACPTATAARSASAA